MHFVFYIFENQPKNSYMSGGASIQGMQRAFKTNIDQIKKFSALKTRRKYMGYKSVDRLETKQFSEEEMAQFKLKLKKQKQHDRIVSLVVILIVLLLLTVALLMISGKLFAWFNYSVLLATNKSNLKLIIWVEKVLRLLHLPV